MAGPDEVTGIEDRRADALLLKSNLEILNAIEVLQYHNKNHLYFGANPKRLSEEIQALLQSSLFAACRLSRALGLPGDEK
jgi:hypothetical protein